MCQGEDPFHPGITKGKRDPSPSISARARTTSVSWISDQCLQQPLSLRSPGLKAHSSSALVQSETAIGSKPECRERRLNSAALLCTLQPPTHTRAHAPDSLLPLSSLPNAGPMSPNGRRSCSQTHYCRGDAGGRWPPAAPHHCDSRGLCLRWPFFGLVALHLNRHLQVGAQGWKGDPCTEQVPESQRPAKDPQGD